MRPTLLTRMILSAVALLATVAGGCALLDEQLENCKETLKITCHLRLFTNVQDQVEARLSDKRDEALRRALEGHLAGIFTEYARDVDLSFYDTDEAGQRQEHRTAVMNADQATYEIELPAREYHHLALANVATEPHVRLTGDELRDESSVVQAASDLLPSQTLGLFSARMPLTVHRDESETFDVNLYMLNSAAALVMHRDSCDYVAASFEILDMADSFRVSDSLYTFAKSTRVLSEEIPVDTTGTVHWRVEPALFCGVGLPSRDASSTKAEGETEETLWRFAVNVTLQDGTTTRTVISVATPLEAGRLVILRGWLHGDGSYEPEPVPDLILSGMSIMLDWREGPDFNPVLG